MRPLQYLTVLRHRWPVVVTGLLVGLLAGGLLAALLPRQYSSDTTLFVAPGPPDERTSAYERTQIAAQRVPSYRELATDGRVTAAVVRDLGLPETPESLATRLQVSSVADALLIDVSVTDPDPARAAAVVDDDARRLSGLVRDLEQPPNPLDPPAVSLVVLRPASVPTAPSGPSPSSYLLLGALGGLVLGALAAVARERTDRRVRSTAVLERTVGAPTLGRLPALEAGPARREALRALRTTLRHLPGLSVPSCLLVTAALPDDGAPPTVLELAGGLAAAGESVLVVDADLRHPRLADLLDLTPGAGLTEVLRGRADLDAAVVHHGPYDVLVSGAPDDGPDELLASSATPSLLARLPHRWDRVLVLGPPLLADADAADLAACTDGVLLVVRWKHTRIEQVAGAVDRVASVSAPIRGTVLVDVPGSPRPAPPAGRDRAERAPAARTPLVDLTARR
ncbi:polysaccharide biosynthesis tyrosine autokinase [Actinomycetospora chiangmaiensis]|uniref:polysaccharide biosynthesis tyrosine autokinase n=1 Tax=Actinomycetospora chiangmaiensis TaxID=402650 RepID=UPI00036572A3|nr:polysaccharide biosynthesis tyrosine autokinase [Actinomycetospora chiangmaiensis]